MPELTAVRFRHNATEYELKLAWDDEALASERAVTFGITAARWPRDNPNLRDEVVATVSIEQEGGELVLKVQVADVPLPAIRLRVLHADALVEQVIERIPAVFLGDPILGCLVRSGISATVGQLIECKNESENVAGLAQRARAIGRCLRQHAVSIGLTAAYRAGKCVVRFGVPIF